MPWERFGAALAVLALACVAIHLALREPRPSGPRPFAPARAPARARSSPPTRPPQRHPAPVPSSASVAVLRELPGRAATRIEVTLSEQHPLELPSAALLVDEVLIEAHWRPGNVRATRLVVEAARAGGVPEEPAPPRTRWAALSTFALAPRSKARYRVRASAPFDRLRLSVRGAGARVMIREVIALPPGHAPDAADALRMLAIERDDPSGVLLSDASARGFWLPAGSLATAPRTPMAAVGHRRHDTILQQYEWHTHGCNVLRLRDRGGYSNGGSADMLFSPENMEWLLGGLGEVPVAWAMEHGAAALARRWRCEAPVDWQHDDALGLTAQLLPSGVVYLHRDDASPAQHYARPAHLPDHAPTPAETRFLRAVRARFEKHLAGRKTICTVEWASTMGGNEPPGFEVLMVTEHAVHVRRIDEHVLSSGTIRRDVGDTFEIPRHFLPPAPEPAVGRKLLFCKSAAPLPERPVVRVHFEVTGERSPQRAWPHIQSAVRQLAMTQAGALAWAAPRLMPLTPSRPIELAVPFPAAHLVLEVTSRQRAVEAAVEPTGAAPARLIVETRAAGDGAWDRHAPVLLWPWAAGWLRLDPARAFDRVRLSCDGPDAELSAVDVVALRPGLPARWALDATRTVTVTRVTSGTVTLQANGATWDAPRDALSALPPQDVVVLAAPDVPVLMFQDMHGMKSVSWTERGTAAASPWDFWSDRSRGGDESWRGKTGYAALMQRAVTFLPERLFEPALELAVLRYPNGRMRFVRGAGDIVNAYEEMGPPVQLADLLAALEGRDRPQHVRNAAENLVRQVGDGAPLERMTAWLRDVVSPRWGAPSPPEAPGMRYRISWDLDRYGRSNVPRIAAEKLPRALLPGAPPAPPGKSVLIERLP